MLIHDIYHNIYSLKCYLIIEVITDSLNAKFKIMRQNATDEQFWVSERELDYSFRPGYPNADAKALEFQLARTIPRPTAEVNFDY